MRSSYFVIFPAIFFALFAKPANADVLGEWTYSQSCPTSGSYEVVSNKIILRGPDQGGCAGQPHWVKIETTIPADVDTVDFTWQYQTNDGWVYDPPQYGINGTYTLLTQQNNATGSKSVPVNEGDVFTFRQYSIDTCCQPGILTISNLSLWESITTSTTSTTTSTTTVPPTTVPVTVPTTTTVPETSTSSSTTTTTTTIPTTTTSTTSTTSSTTSTTTTSTTVLPATSTSSSTTSTTTTSSTTTSSVPQTTSSVSVPTTTLPPEPSTSTEPPEIYEPEPTEPYVPEEPEITETGTTTTVVEEPIQEETPLEETTTTTEPSPEETYPETTEPEVVDTTPETLPDAPLSEEEVTSILEEATTTEELVEALADLSPEQVSQVIKEILAEEPTQEQAAALATSPEVLAVVSAQEAEQIFEALDVAELTDAQTEQLIEAIESAPTEIREQFENTIDIFGEGLDDYTPIGSNIPVGERRTLIAATLGISLAAAGARIKR